MATSVQHTYRRNVNPFVAGQIANGRECQIESGRLAANGNFPSTLPFGFGVGWTTGVADANGSALLRGHVVSREITASNFAGIAVQNVALPGTNDPTDTYNLNDIVSIGSEGDFVVVCSAAVTRLQPCYVNTNTSNYATYGTFIGASGSNRTQITGAIFVSESRLVTPYSGGTALNLAVLRVRQMPR